MSETNTLVIHRLPKPLIEKAVEALNAQAFAGIVRFIQLRFLRRALAMFDTVESAAAALPAMRQVIGGVPGCEKAQVGFSITTNDLLAKSHLQLPDPGTLLFVSPPPSPPNEWQETLEEEPNQRTHFEDDFNVQLSRALKAYQESPSPGGSPVNPKGQFPESPRTVTIIEARPTNPALEVTASDDS